MVFMATTFWARIDWADPLEDPFSMGLLQVPTKFRTRWGKLQSKAIEKLLSRALNSKPVSTGNLADILPYSPVFQEDFPRQMRRRYPHRRDYLKLFRKLGRTLFQPAFTNWLTTVRGLTQVHFQDVFEIAAANPDRTPYDDPQQFAYQFLQVLIDDVVEKKVDGLASDDFLKFFLEIGNPRRVEADMVVLLRQLVRSALVVHIMDLSSTAQIELAKIGWKKAGKTVSVLAQKSQLEPVPDEAGSAHASRSNPKSCLRQKRREARPRSHCGTWKSHPRVCRFVTL
jgi:hypothetical protein